MEKSKTKVKSVAKKKESLKQKKSVSSIAQGSAMQKIKLIINTGSSSLKVNVYSEKNEELFAFNYQKIGTENAVRHLRIRGEKIEDKKRKDEFMNHYQTLSDAIAKIGKVYKNFQIDYVAHRLVHGGEEIVKPALITVKTLDQIYELIPAAPLHNPANLIGILAIYKIFYEQQGIDGFPEITPDLENFKEIYAFIWNNETNVKIPPMSVIPDTAPHVHDMEQKNYTYAIGPEARKLLKEVVGSDINIRRFGFHGSSYEYIRKTYKVSNGVIMHLGNGSSAAVIVDGKIKTTSMGFTPLEGLIMGTRAGDIDPAIAIMLVNALIKQSLPTMVGTAIVDGLIQAKNEHDSEIRQKLIEAAELNAEAMLGKLQKIESAPHDADNLLNKKSGLLGMTGTNAMDKILAEIKAGNDTDGRYQLAIDIWKESIKKYLNSYIGHLPSNPSGENKIIFTGGIGENADTLIVDTLKEMSFFNFKILNYNKNDLEKKGYCKIAVGINKLNVYMARTNEELHMLRATEELLEELKNA